MNLPAKLVLPLHFEDYGGKEFERLVFAYHVRAYRWRSLEWYGQIGSDMGRDIWGVRIDDASKDETICIQCANRKSFTTAKAIRDINKVLISPSGRPDGFKFVCATSVSSKSRDKIKKHAKGKGIRNCEIWSGTEFEEYLRSCCESLLARFVKGVSFPDSADEIKRFAQNIQVPCNVPYPPAPHFVQPGTAWIKLQDSLASLPQPFTTRHAIVLYGLHGIGKTQAACAIAWTNRSDYSAILWMRGDSIEVLRSSFGRLCDLEALDLPEQKERELDKRASAVRRWLKEHTGWILIADNMDNEEVRDALFEWVAPSFAGIVLATSCLRDWPPTCNRIEFDFWDAPLCADFFVKRLGLSPTDKPIAATIGNLLGGLPIALEQAAAYIEQTRTPLRLYLPKLVADVNQELDRHTPGSTNYPASFAAVLKQSVVRLSPEGRFLLKLTSFLAPEGQFLRIYETIITNSSPNHVKKLGIQYPLVNPEANVMELSRWSLVQQRGIEFDVHPLVQAVIRDSLTQAEKEHCLAVLGQLFFAWFGRVAAPYNSSYWNVWHAVFPHMEIFTQHIREKGDRRALGYLLNHMGLFLESQGLHKKAVAMLSEAVEVAKSIAGPDHPDTAAALSNLAELLTSIGRPAEAKPHLLDATAIVKNHKPLVPHAESSCWNNLGLCHKALGERDDAETAFRKALAFDSARGGSNDDFGLIHQSNLAVLLDDDPKQKEETEKLYRNVVAKMKDEVRLAAALTNLGAFLYRTERAPEAVTVLERANKILPKYFPPNHPEIKRTALHLAVARKKASGG